MLATKSSDPYVPENRWIASLSDGKTIFQDATPNQDSAWSRLRQYLLSNNILITQLRLQAYGHNITCPQDPDIIGYWFMRRLTSMRGFHPSIDNDKYEMGIGFIKESKIFITWIREDGILSTETRDLKQDDFGVILNDK